MIYPTFLYGKTDGFPDGYSEMISDASKALLSSTPTTWKQRKNYLILAKLFFEKNKAAYLYGMQANSDLDMFMHVLSEDTLLFLKEGRRRLSIELLASYGPSLLKSVRRINSVEDAHYKETFEGLYNLNTMSLMTKWLSMPGGLSDMIHFIDICVNRYWDIKHGTNVCCVE